MKHGEKWIHVLESPLDPKHDFNPIFKDEYSKVGENIELHEF